MHQRIVPQHHEDMAAGIDGDVGDKARVLTINFVLLGPLSRMKKTSVRLRASTAAW
jgi:hypothetical protein